MPPIEMKAVLSAAPRATVPVKPEHKVTTQEDPQVRQQQKTRLGGDEALEAATSPRVRRRLSNAQESASIFSMGALGGGLWFVNEGLIVPLVCEQGEVVQWMTACHPDLTAFGLDLERRGYRTLSSIAFLTEEDIESVTDLDLRRLLLATLTRLRHELFRM